MHYLILIFFAYLLGSIPTAVWLGKWIHGIDVRQYGSKSAGATNTIRVLGLKVGLPVLFIDALKGFCAVYLGYVLPCNLNDEHMAIFLVILAIAAVLGHVFPIFAKFKGGKGVATLLGIALAIFPYIVLILIGIFAIVFIITRYVSLASMSAAIAFPFISILIFNNTEWAYIIFAVIVAIFVPLTHIKNIKRLLNGTENKMFFKKQT